MSARIHQLAVAVAVAVGLALAPTSSVAGPSVIRDERLADLAVTPALGRGYAPATNEMYSVCFEQVVTTKASFDFDYSLEELESEDSTTYTRRTSFRATEVAEFLRANTRQRTLGSGESRRYVHYLLATLTVDSYYSSVDEGKAKLADSALALLRAGDALGFFAACGTHYVRSISRRSYFLTLFSYTTASRKRDAQFEGQLDRAIHSIDFRGGSARADQTEAARLDRGSRERDLKIVSRSIGLEAQKSVDLIPTDLSSYKESVRQAFKASQDEHAGRITSIELSSWLANPTVVDALQLSPAVGDQAPHGRFASVQMIGHNAEFYTQLSSRVRAFENLVDKAEECRTRLDSQFLDGGAIPARLGNPVVLDHRTGEQMPLQALVDGLSDANLAALRDAEQAFAVGSNGAPGAAQCIQELERGGLSEKLHTEIPACSVAVPRLPITRLVDDYCMPELAPVEIEIEIADELEPWIEASIERFEQQNPRIRVKVTPRGSFDAVQRILDGRDRPTVWSPGDSVVSVQLAEAWKAKHGTELFPTTGDDEWQPLALSPLVVVAWKDRAEQLLRASHGQLSWRTIHDVLASPRGWASIGAPASWGALKPVHGDPTLSNSGLQTLVAIALEYYDKRELAPADIEDQTFQRRLRELEDGVIEFPDRSRTVMDELARWGPSWYDLAVVPESVAINQLAATERQWGELRVMYPRTTIWSDHPVVVLDGDWVSAPQRAAGRQLVAFLRSPEVQATTVQYGLRPADASIQLGVDDAESPFARMASRGFSRTLPPAVDMPSDEVLDLLAKAWSAMVPPSRRWDRPR
jgi:hypothetical protein